MEVSAAGNGYMQDTKPWELKTASPDRCATVVALAAFQRNEKSACDAHQPPSTYLRNRPEISSNPASSAR